MADFNVFLDTDQLATAAADHIARLLSEALDQRPRATLVLTGGKTPEPVYRSLADHHKDTLDWRRVDFFWGDDRFVPPDHEESNVRLAEENLFARLRIGDLHVYPFPVTADTPEDAARSHEQTLRAYFAGDEPRFDVVLLGVGADGHVASLFPGSSSLAEKERWVLHTEAPAGNPITDRLTMTLPLLNAGRSIVFLVAGEKKSDAVAAATGSNQEAPAGRIQGDGDVAWFLDEAAAQEVHV